MSLLNLLESGSTSLSNQDLNGRPQRLRRIENLTGLEDSLRSTNLDPGGAPATEGPGQIRGEGSLQKTFNKTNLDLTNPLPLGGPINVSYTSKVGSEIKSFSTTQPYTPENTYKDSLQSAELIARASDQF